MFYMIACKIINTCCYLLKLCHFVEFKSEFDYKHKGVVKWQCLGGYMVWNELEQGVRIWDGTISKVIGNVFDDSKLNEKYGKIWSKEIVVKCRN